MTKLVASLKAFHTAVSTHTNEYHAAAFNFHPDVNLSDPITCLGQKLSLVLLGRRYFMWWGGDFVPAVALQARTQFPFVLFLPMLVSVVRQYWHCKCSDVDSSSVCPR